MYIHLERGEDLRLVTDGSEAQEKKDELNEAGMLWWPIKGWHRAYPAFDGSQQEDDLALIRRLFGRDLPLRITADPGTLPYEGLSLITYRDAGFNGPVQLHNPLHGSDSDDEVEVVDVDDALKRIKEALDTLHERQKRSPGPVNEELKSQRAEIARALRR